MQLLRSGEAQAQKLGAAGEGGATHLPPWWLISEPC